MKKNETLLCLALLASPMITAPKKKVLVINATPQEKKELMAPAIQAKYECIFHYIYNPDYSLAHGSLRKLVRALKKKYPKAHLDGIVCTQDYFGNICMSLLAQKLNLPGPSPVAVLTCHHKYYGRIAQAKHVPSATPRFGLIDPNAIDKSVKKLPFTFPFFVKPIKAYFSFGATPVADKAALKSALRWSLPEKSFLTPLNTIIFQETPYKKSANYLLAEELLEGAQCTLEGFAYHGTYYRLGVIDSIMYPGTISFHHFEYPSRLSPTIQQRMASLSYKIMRNLGFDNSFFNIEFMYNPKTDTIHIIEINPRSVAQFADFYEKVDGLNSYEIMLAIATGNRLPQIKKSGKHAIAGSFALRTFDNKYVTHSPTGQELKKIYTLFPDARIMLHVQKGQKLSKELQDGKSYLYAVFNIGGQNRDDLMQQSALCKKMLPYSFKKISI